MIAIVMGVSGSGKTTIGKALARKLGWRFIEGDDFHPPQNVAKMAAGIPLEDADRQPWLERIHEELRRLEKNGESAVVACSALKHAYRKRLRAGLKALRFVYLHGSLELIRARVAKRKHRYMPASLLESQFATLEPPQDALAVDVAGDVRASVAAIARELRAR